MEAARPVRSEALECSRSDVWDCGGFLFSSLWLSVSFIPLIFLWGACIILVALNEDDTKISLLLKKRWPLWSLMHGVSQDGGGDGAGPRSVLASSSYSGGHLESLPCPAGPSPSSS